MGRITAAFALGQIAGPVLSALLLSSHGLALALQAGALGLLASGAWLWRRTFHSTHSKETAHA